MAIEPEVFKSPAAKLAHLDRIIGELCDSRLELVTKLNELATSLADLRKDLGAAETANDQAVRTLHSLMPRIGDVERRVSTLEQPSGT